MASWRKRMMPLAEWSTLQERFGELQMERRGDPDLALFIQDSPGDDLSAIYMTGPGIDLIERLFPGDWQDAEAPNGKGVSLLVGTAGSWEHFGLAKPQR